MRPLRPGFLLGLVVTIFFTSAPSLEAVEPGESLRLRFRIDGVSDTWDLATRARGELAQVFLHDSPWLQVNLNVTRQKTTLHFFLPAERAENGPWVASDLRGVEGLAAERGLERVKVAALDLARLRGGVDYEILFRRNDAAGELEVFLNGERQGDVLPANKGPWKPVRVERALRAAGGRLGPAGEGGADLRVLSDERLSGPVDAARALALAADLEAPKREGRAVRRGGIDLGRWQVEPLHVADFAARPPRVIAERDLFDAAGERRVREPAADEWVLEGAGRAEARGAALRISNGGEAAGATGASGHLVLWAPWELPEDYLVEYDFTPQDARRGLHILFWSARHRDGGSLFELGRRKRDGVFGEYLWRGIHSYHASVFATDDNTPRRVANLRKNDGFVLAACGEDRIAGRGEGPFRIRLLKVGPKMTLEVDGVVALEWHDDGRANGAALGGGRLGFRTMAHTGAAEIANLRVHRVRPRPELAAGPHAAETALLDFVGMRAEGPPAGAKASGGATMRLEKDNALDAEGFWKIRAPEGFDNFVDALVPLPASREAGRYTVTLRARSLDRKWLLLAFMDGEREHWTHSEQLSAGVREFRQEAVLPAAEGERALRLRFRGPGSVEIAAARVEAVNPERLVAAAAARWPEGAPVNLLRHSRLPLGLPTGWALDRHVDDEGEAELGGDESVPGALRARVRPGGEAVFNTEPFAPALPGRAHVAGFAVKGAGRGSVVVVADGRERGPAVSFEGGEDWRTVSVGFDADPLARLWHLRLRLEGDLWLDRFQVNDGERLRHAEAKRVELTLAPGTRSRVHAVASAEERSRVEWAVVAAPAGARLVARVVSIYGEVRELPAVTLRGGAEIERGSLDYTPESARAFGVFRIEARVEDAAGRALGPEAETVVHRVRRARHADAFAPESPFGVHTLPTARHREMAKQIGMNWVRLHDAGGLEWAALEPRPGEWRFNDETVRRYRDSKFEILGVLGTSPLWANAWPGDRTPIHSFWDKWGAPGDLDAWARYVGKVAQRYREDIRAFEVWNEPWIPRFFSGRREPQPVGEPLYFHSETPQRDYAELSRRTAEALREAGSEATVIGLNSTAGEGISNRISGRDWAKGVAETDGIRSMDALSYHHYSTARLGYAGDDVEAGFARALGPLFGPAGAVKPVWMTEGANTPGGLPGTFYRHMLPMLPANCPEELADSAEGLLRYVVAMLATGNERIFLYSMHTHGFFGERLRFTSLVQPDGFLHPDAAAFAALAWQLEGRRFAGREARADATIYRFVGGSGDSGVEVVVPREGRRVVPATGALDLWGNPVDGRATGRMFLQGGHK